MSKSTLGAFALSASRQAAAIRRLNRGRVVADMFPDTISPEDETGDERYTTRETIAWVLDWLECDGFDLDVAACAESHWAARYYTKADDGLSKPWHGVVWCNPPYSAIAPWVTKARAEIKLEATCIAMLIPATRSEQKFWQKDIEPFRDCNPTDGVNLSTRFLPGRIGFARPGSGGVAQAGVPFGCVLVCWDRRP